jgi:hypothetical protein
VNRIESNRIAGNRRTFRSSLRSSEATTTADRVRCDVSNMAIAMRMREINYQLLGSVSSTWESGREKVRSSSL